jgi:CheY-like chemotaxis protein
VGNAEEENSVYQYSEGSKKKVLVVDDDPGIIYAMRLLLEEEGYAVTLLDRGEEVEKVLATNPPDIILLDMLLSGKDGRAITRQLKSQEQTRHIPIIMFSAHPSLSKEAPAAGADDFMTKPFKIEVLLEKLARYT